MSTYIRGPICGTDNCPSRLWRIIAGRRTCHYGHVMEGDVEYNNEDDDTTGGGVVTRRLNLTTNATGNFQSSMSNSQMLNSQRVEKDKKLYGYEANLLFLKSYQYIIKKQCSWLIQEKNFPEDFKKIVKIIWMKYLKSVSTTAVRNDNIFSAEEEEYDTDFNSKRKRNDKKLGLHMSSTVAFLYMASMHCGIPVYMCDYIEWICNANLPYFKSNELLPKHWKQRLPNHYLGILEGGCPPHDAQLYKRVVNLSYRIGFSLDFDARFFYEGLLLKLVLSSLLPPEFYLYSVRLIELIDSKEQFSLYEDESHHFKKFYLCSEVRTIAHFVLCLRWVLICDVNNRYPIKWLDAYIGNSETDELSSIGIDKKLAKLAYDSNSRDVLDWTKKDSLEYLKWIETKFLPTLGRDINNEPSLNIDKRIAKRQLYKLLSTEFEPTKNSNTGIQISYIEEFEKKYKDIDNSTEIDPMIEDKDYDTLEARIKKIRILEEKVINKTSLDFSISKDQLVCCIKNVELHCDKQLRS